METRTNTVKILDNTVISASLRELVSINLLERCSQRYDIVTSQEVYEEAKSYFGNKLYQTLIPRNIRLAEAPSFGQPIILYDILSTGANSYIALAKEVMGIE